MGKSSIEFYNIDGYYKWTSSSFKQDRVRKLYKCFFDLVNNKSGLNVLDIGSGTGDFISYLAENFPLNTYYGNDVSTNVVAMNQKNKKNITWSVDDFNAKTRYEDGFFDVVIAGEIIEHLSDTDFFLAEVYRIMKHNGYFIITTPNLASWLDRFMLLFGMQPFSTEASNISRTFGREKFYKFIGFKESQSAGHLRCFTKGALIALLKFYKFKFIKEIPCHVHNMLTNKIVDVVFPKMSQNMLIVVQK